SHRLGRGAKERPGTASNGPGQASPTPPKEEAHMASVPHPELSETPRIAIYARVSTEDQAEKQTVQAQLDFLRRWADLHEFPIADVYVDDGWSGTVPLRDRPDGRRLLDDAAARRFTTVAL